MLKSTHVLLLFIYFFKIKKARCFLLFSSFLFVCLGNEAETEGELSVNFTLVCFNSINYVFSPSFPPLH